MGSFNTACFASGQVIATGDKAYLMPILQASTYDPVEMSFNGEKLSLPGISNMNCYPHSFWEPYGAFIEAEYHDYGQFHLVDTPINRVRLVDFILGLPAKAAVVEQGENEYHDVPFNLEKLLEEKAPILHAGKDQAPMLLVRANEGSDALFKELEVIWANIWEVATENRLFAANYRDEPRPLQLAVMHAEAYARLLQMNESRQRPVFDKVLASVKAAMDSRMAAATSDEQREALVWSMTSRITSGLERLGSFEGMDFHCEVEILDEAIEVFCVGKVDADQLFATIKPVLDTRCVMLSLNHLNLRLSPQIYSGQDYSNEAGRDYAKFVQEVSAAVTQQRRERFGEDFDDE